MLQSQEQSLKPFGLRITGMALSNQLPAFFSLLQVNLKFSHRILPNRTIPKDDLPRLAKSQKMTNPVWPNPGVTDIGHIPELLTLATSRLVHAKISKEDLMKPAA
jgi:hypothetical protein